MAREQFQNLTEPMYYTLLALGEERHGYEIMQFIEKFTEKRVIIGPGTLYNLLSRFQKDGFIEQVSDDGRRKTYIMTTKGRELLGEEINRLNKLIRDGKNILYSLKSYGEDEKKEGGIKEIKEKTKEESQNQKTEKKNRNESKKIQKNIFKRPDDEILF